MQYDFNLAANGAQFVDVAGRFFKYKSGLGPIRVRISTGGYVDILPGQGVFGLDFSSVSITDISGAANKGVLLAGEYDFRDDRISGTVDVVDGGKSRTMAGMAFQGSTLRGANPGEWPYIELWNPVGSVKRLILKSMMMSNSATAQQMAVVMGSVALSQLPGGAVVNKLAGAAAGAAEIRTQSYAGLGLMAGGDINLPYVAANNSLTVAFTEPIILMPGQGIAARGQTSGTLISASFEWIEELI